MMDRKGRKGRQKENGSVLLYTIIVTLVIMMAIVPLLSYLSVSLFATEKSLSVTEGQLTRGDAGIEYAIAKLKNDRPLLTSLSSRVLTPMAIPIPPFTINQMEISSLTATLLTPSQWDLVKLPNGARNLYVSLALPELALPHPEPPRAKLLPPTNAGSNLALAPVATISKTASPSQVAPGEQVTYTITINNTGDATAVPSSIVDNLPSGSGFSCILGSTTGGITANPKVTGGGLTLTWDSVPTIAPGGSLVFSFRVLTGSTTGQFYNRATVSGNFPTADTGNTAPVFVGPSMRITKTVSPGVAPAGTNVVYTITIFNDTAGTVANLTQVRDTLPSGFSYVNNSTTGAITANPSITGQVNLTWSGVWAIAGGASFTFSFQATTTLNWGTNYNSVAITGTNFPDRTTGPTVGVTTVGWIQINKTVDNPSPGAAEVVTYTVTVRNVGPSSVAISQITDTLPTTFVYVSGSTRGNVTGDPSITGNTLMWSGAQIPSSIAAYATISFTFRAATPQTPDTYYNQSDIYVTWLGNNYHIGTGPTAPVSVVAQPRIAISETSGDRSGPPGWSNVNVTGYNFPPQKTIKLYWVDLNNPLDPTTNPPNGTDLLPGQTLITLSTSYAPLSFNPVAITIPSNTNWGNGYVVAMMQETGTTWVEQDRKPFNVRAKYEIVSRTSDGISLTARVAFTGTRSTDGTFSTPTNTPVITIYSWRE